jgi:FkbM family methyltransferase
MAIARRITLSVAAAFASKIANNLAAQKLLFNSIRLSRPEFSQLWSQAEIRFLNYCFCMRSRSRSQILQDLWVCFELNDKRNGFFVEFGATNGLLNSNTWLLETELGWNGILAEPNPFWHAALAANRRAAIEHKCVSSTSGSNVAFITTDDSDPELSGISKFSEGDHFSELRKQGKVIEVETISLSDLLEKYQAPELIDYLSIDTEGSELDTLSAHDFKKHRFSLISVEQNPLTESGIQHLLEGQGYIRVFPQFSQWDGWYVSAKLRDKLPPQIFAPLV